MGYPPLPHTDEFDMNKGPLIQQAGYGKLLLPLCELSVCHTGFLFSIICLYLVTAILVMWKPDSENTTSQRISSAVVANSTMLAVAGLVISARIFSGIGDMLVDLVVEIVVNMETCRVDNTKSRLCMDDL